MRSAGGSVFMYTDRCNSGSQKYSRCGSIGTPTCVLATAVKAQSDRRALLVLIVLSGLIISLCMGLRQSLGLFMRPMTVDLGITAATFGFSIALQNIVWGVTQPFVGALADKHGP